MKIFNSLPYLSKLSDILGIYYCKLYIIYYELPNRHIEFNKLYTIFSKALTKLVSRWGWPAMPGVNAVLTRTYRDLSKKQRVLLSEIAVVSYQNNRYIMSVGINRRFAGVLFP